MNEFKKSTLRLLPFFLSVPAMLWQLLFLCIPLLIIIYYSISPAAASSFSLQCYAKLFHMPFAYILCRSLLLASATATITLLFCYPVVYYLVFHLRSISRYVVLCIMVPFWTNFLMLAYSWFFLLERNGLINTLLLKIGIISTPLSLVYNFGAVLIVMVYCYIPFMVMPLYTSLEKLDKRLLEASADLGATPWQSFMQITLPLSMPGIMTGFMLVFVPAFGEFAIPILLGGSRFFVVGSLISYYFSVARNNCLGAACTILAALFLLTVVLSIQKLGQLYVWIRKGRML
jgi:spermidine/putrescine transport system permease protein